MGFSFRGLAAVSAAGADTIRTGFTLSGDLGKGDDNNSQPASIGCSANFYGTTASQVYVNNNGNITFGSKEETYTPYGLLTDVAKPIIAPFFADVDTRDNGSTVKFGTTTIDENAAFVVNWLNVGFFNGAPGTASPTTNSFHLVLISNGNGNFDFEFNYGSILWETGTASASGGNANGLGGNSARVGFSNGASGSNRVAVELTGSGVNGAFLDGGPNALVSKSNIGVAGRYKWSVTNGVAEVAPSVSAVPVPATLPLLLVGPVAFAMIRRKRKA